MTRPAAVIGPMLAEWRSLRADLRAMEEAEHPDVTDALGRVWTWVSGDLYRHDSMAWPLAHVLNPAVGWSRAGLLDNPNYRFCGVCREGMSRTEAA
ncbi:hypothetical protein [Micromonospora sp. NPDC047730]|uniref:hypothetical protein n=1 Tax=Micromonospora sp. NPDC047730 TaxID=3364253 RepID=UPI003711D9E7